jgi:predicted nucleic acid-binding protein
LIALRNIGRLDILRELYGFVTITPEVAAEYGEILPEWVSVVAVEDNCKTRLIGRTLDLGEASTIALAMESREALLILDDGKARCFAKNLGMSLTGTLGVMAKAYRAGYIDDLTEVINDFRRCGFYIPNDIEHELLRRE